MQCESTKSVPKNENYSSFDNICIGELDFFFKSLLINKMNCLYFLWQIYQAMAIECNFLRNNTKIVANCIFACCNNTCCLKNYIKVDELRLPMIQQSNRSNFSANGTSLTILKPEIAFNNTLKDDAIGFNKDAFFFIFHILSLCLLLSVLIILLILVSK